MSLDIHLELIPPPLLLTVPLYSPFILYLLLASRAHSLHSPYSLYREDFRSRSILAILFLSTLSVLNGVLGLAACTRYTHDRRRIKLMVSETVTALSVGCLRSYFPSPSWHVLCDSFQFLTMQWLSVSYAYSTNAFLSLPHTAHSNSSLPSSSYSVSHFTSALNFLFLIIIFDHTRSNHPLPTGNLPAHSSPPRANTVITRSFGSLLTPFDLDNSIVYCAPRHVPLHSFGAPTNGHRVLVPRTISLRSLHLLSSSRNSFWHDRQSNHGDFSHP